MRAHVEIVQTDRVVLCAEGRPAKASRSSHIRHIRACRLATIVERCNPLPLPRDDVRPPLAGTMNGAVALRI